MIDVRHLSKWYGPHPAVRDVSFRVDEGEVVGFLGPNGAGKSTTLRILTGFLGPTHGEVRVCGFDVATEALAARRSLGYMPESCPLHPELRVAEYLRFRAELKGVPRRDRARAVARAAEDAALGEVVDRPIGELSKGFRQRVGLADALVASPPLLVLDEPTAGLDPNQIRDVRALVRRLRERHTIFLSTHILPEVENVCSRAVVIARGRVVASGTIPELRAQRAGSRLLVRVGGAPDAVERAVRLARGLDGVASATSEEGEVHLELSGEREPDDVAERTALALTKAGLRLRELRPLRASLEEVFEQLTTQPDAAAGSPEGGAVP